MEQEEEVSHFEKNKKTDIENNAIVGLETLASGTPELPMEICDEAPEPRPRAEAPVPHDPAESPSWDLQRKISRQIEYYFGDYNLPRDKFMLDLMLEDEGRFRNTGIPDLSSLYVCLSSQQVVLLSSRVDLHGQDDHFPATRCYVHRPGRDHGRDRELRQRTTHGGRS